MIRSDKIEKKIEGLKNVKAIRDYNGKLLVRKIEVGKLLNIKAIGLPLKISKIKVEKSFQKGS